MKSYVDGPDVDVNFAILDGEVLFFDVLDNFPSAGDMTGGTPGNNDLPETIVFMLEVNPREPGYNGRIAIIWIFGVDYYALHLYRYIEDTWHYRAATPPILNVAQHMSVMDFVPLYRIVFEQCQHVTSSDAVDMVLVYDAS
ncbi:MAG: hypothetical protein LQ342_006853 [Letrouitia transgressa]|nr:MAG: hypothetical protein LQ342_006853 [Letrouitia transgressa]